MMKLKVMPILILVYDDFKDSCDDNGSDNSDYDTERFPVNLMIVLIL